MNNQHANDPNKKKEVMSGHLDFKENKERIVLQEKPSRKDIKQQTALSFNTWKRINAGYYVPPKPVSTIQDHYRLDKRQIDPVDKQHNRKADKFTHYVEARERYKLLSTSNAKAAQAE